MERIPAWTDFIREAKPTVEALGNLRISSFGKVLPLSESLSGDSPPRREAGEGIAVGVEASTGSISHCLNAGGMGRQDYESETLIAHTLRGDGFDASEDGTGRGTPLVPVAFDCKGTDCQPGDISPTLRSMNHNASHANAGGQVAVATCIPIDMRQASRGATMTNNRSDGACSGGAPGTGIGEAGDPSPTVSTSHPPAVAFTQNQCGDVLTGPVMPSMGTSQNATGRNTPKVQLGLAVRRLTPRECERLQGFSDNYTAITYRNKPAADGPRYKALGNSMAVPCVRWIAERIELADALNTGKDS